MCISCPGGPDVFLPATEISRPQKRERLPHPFQGVIGISNGKRYTRNKKRKDLPTEQLSSLDFTKEIETYLTSLSRADCCVSVQGEPRKCKCFSFLADKPSIIKVVACGLKKYFDLDDLTRKFVLTSEEWCANRLTGSSLKYQLPIFRGQITGDDDFGNDLEEAMKLSICQSAWSTIFNLGRTKLETVKKTAKGDQSMVHGNTGKRNVDDDKEKAYQEIISTLQFEQDNHSSPFATRIVRDNAGRSSIRKRTKNS